MLELTIIVVMVVVMAVEMKKMSDDAADIRYEDFTKNDEVSAADVNLERGVDFGIEEYSDLISARV